MAAGLTLDSGAVVAWERGDVPVVDLLRAAMIEAELTLRVPANVVAETWRGGRSARVAKLLGLCNIVPVTEELARRAGVALAAVGGANTIDATVVATAAWRGDVVITSDPDDLTPLCAHFGNVRLLPIATLL